MTAADTGNDCHKNLLISSGNALLGFQAVTCMSDSDSQAMTVVSFH